MKELGSDEGQVSTCIALPSGGEAIMTRCRVLRCLWHERGQSLVEFALVLPLLFLLILNAVNFAGYLYAWITVANAARAGADYAIMSPSLAVGAVQPITPAEITGVVTTDVTSLPNKSSLVVNVCQNNNGVISTLAGTCSSIASDPEPTEFVLTSVGVTYTYQPYIAAFSFPRLGVHLTIPPTTMTRVAVMRSIQ